MSTFLLFVFASLADAQLSSTDLAKEINTLKEVVQAQDRRIEALERELADLKARLTPTSSQSTRSGPIPAQGGWRNPDNWKRIKANMSEQQVIAILGRPTRRDGVGRVTVFYEGEVEGAGYVSGNIGLWDNQVMGTAFINPPVFNP